MGCWCSNHHQEQYFEWAMKFEMCEVCKRMFNRPYYLPVQASTYLLTDLWTIVSDYANPLIVRGICTACSSIDILLGRFNYDVLKL